MELSLRGSDLTVKSQSELAYLTNWSEVTPLELRLTIDLKIIQDKPLSFDHENSCPICMQELYEKLGEK